MTQRKIQLIAGTTYTISLPKKWVEENSLKAHDAVDISEHDDGTLAISARKDIKRDITSMRINIDDYLENIEQVLFVIYYLGAEEILLTSKKELGKESKARIRKALTHMSGTEITHEDKTTIQIRVLLDKSKVVLTQVLYRIGLLLESSINGIIEKSAIDEIRINENEIDRLYHLITKMISLSLIDPGVKKSTGIEHSFLVPPYFLIAKRLENIGDNINRLAQHLDERRAGTNIEILSAIKSEIDASLRALLQKKGIFRVNKGLKALEEKILLEKDRTVRIYLRETVRLIIDVQEEIVNISFFKSLNELSPRIA